MIFVAIIGSRVFPDFGMVREFVRSLNPKDFAIVSGGYALKQAGHQFGCYCDECESIRSAEGKASGVDLVAMETAWELGFNTISVPAHWKAHGRGAGFRRNPLIAQLATFGVAFYDGTSRGTGDTISHFQRLGKDCYVIRHGDELPSLSAIQPPDEYPLLDWNNEKH